MQKETTTNKNKLTNKSQILARELCIQRAPLARILHFCLDDVASDSVATVTARLRPGQRHRVLINVLNPRLTGCIRCICNMSPPPCMSPAPCICYLLPVYVTSLYMSPPPCTCHLLPVHVTSSLYMSPHH